MRKLIQDIERIVCYHEQIDPVLLHAKGKKEPFCTTRQMIITLAYEHNHTLTSAGAYFGKDHATALSARKSIYNRVDTNKDFKEKYIEFKKLIMDKEVLKVSYLSSELERLKSETLILQEQLNQIAI